MRTEQIFSAEEMFPFYPLIQQLQPWLKEEHYRSHLQEMTQHNYSQLVVWENEQPVGMSGIWLNHKLYCGKYLEMDNVVVDTNYRNKGIGNLLYEKALEIAVKENCRVMMLDAYLENTGAHRFYERYGFEKQGFHFIKKIEH